MDRVGWVAAIAGGLIVVGVLIHFVTGPGSSSAQHQTLSTGELNLGIRYGSTPKQVQRRLGAPATKHGSCWVYRGHGERVAGFYTGPYIDAMRFCFSDGPTGIKVVTNTFAHIVAHTVHKRTIPAQWIHTFTIARPPPPPQ
jgi:hypothetical protein